MGDLKLWLISQDENTNYDTYDSAVVVAETADAARAIHPSRYTDEPLTEEGDTDWAPYSRVEAEVVGTAAPGLKAGTVICSSFNAG